MMSTLARYEKVEFKTIDGVTLRGWLYSVDGRAPAIIMTPGVSTLNAKITLDMEL